MINANIAHYKITAKLGQGGMGEVYGAVDTQLDREVALKLLPKSFADDPARLARFERQVPKRDFFARSELQIIRWPPASCLLPPTLPGALPPGGRHRRLPAGGSEIATAWFSRLGYQ